MATICCQLYIEKQLILYAAANSVRFVAVERQNARLIDDCLPEIGIRA